MLSSLLQKYAGQGPRYTSYPTALSLQQGAELSHLKTAAWCSADKQLSLYLHLPFCRQLCYYCACNKQITQDYGKAEVYLMALRREISQMAGHMGGFNVGSIHLGGGSPNFFKAQDLAKLLGWLRSDFQVSANAQVSIEADPRHLTPIDLSMLAKAGYQRISFGVQDFDPYVQHLINRVQPYLQVKDCVYAARQAGFDSINLDLIYGLPGQSVEGFAKTLAQVVKLRPERVALFHYAHMPDKFAAQRKIPATSLPGPEDKSDLVILARNTFARAGYCSIGLDHFALPDDELVLAQQQGYLNRNFQGYTATPETQVLGLGVSAISQIGDTLLQNHKSLGDYLRLVREQGHGLERYYQLTRDDQIRAQVIKALMCQFKLKFAGVEQHFGIRFSDYFAHELRELQVMQQDGLLHLSDDAINVTEAGRAFIRNVCMCFDQYLTQRQQSYSQVH